MPSSIKAHQGAARLGWVLRTLVDMTDFVFICNDHTAVIGANLACYLRTLPADEPVYAGQALANAQGQLFNSGAAGYVLSRTTVDMARGCDWSTTDEHLANNPSLVLAECLHLQGVWPEDTRDESLRTRFHAYGLVQTATSSYDDWFVRMIENLPTSLRSPIAPAAGCCATYTVSFHYVEAPEQRALRAALEATKTLHRSHVVAWLDNNWPSNGLGGYSFPVPRRTSRKDQEVLSIRTDIRDALAKIQIAPDDATCPDHKRAYYG